MPKKYSDTSFLGFFTKDSRSCLESVVVSEIENRHVLLDNWLIYIGIQIRVSVPLECSFH